jgi:DNA ligase-1
MALMLTGDTGETAVLAKENRLDEARLRLLHPIKFMLASPAEDAADILGRLGPTVWVEDKYDGIRAQLHRRGSEVRLYSRDLHDISGQFPEIVEAAGPLDWDGILDGEILAYADGHVLPFLTLQGRLGRKDPSAHVQSEVPVVYVAFDLLAIGPRSAYVNGSLNGHHPLEPGRSTFTAAAAAADGTGRGVMGAAAVIDVAGGTGTAGAPDHSPGHSTDSSARVRGNGTSALLPLLATPLAERRGRLEALGLPTIAEGGRFALSHLMTAGSAETLDGLFGEARGRRNEGLMVKDPNSGYSPGRRGLGWLKMKRALATLDCVVVGVEAGHGKRHGVLSDYTFAVRDDSGERLVTIGKAYTGLTDAEIAEMTRWFEAHTIAQYGRYRQVEPTAVVEVAFDVIQRSNRHQSGFALRFPRIVGLRMDKSPTEIDTLATVERLHRELQYGAEYLVTAEAKHTRSRPAGTV